MQMYSFFFENPFGSNDNIWQFQNNRSNHVHSLFWDYFPINLIKSLVSEENVETTTTTFCPNARAIKII